MHDIRDILAQRFKRRLLVSCLSTIIGGPCMCAGLFLLFQVVFPALETTPSRGFPGILIILFLGAVAVLLVAPVLAVFSMTLRRARALDAVFLPLGLTGSIYMLYGRQYHGVTGGRQVDVYVYRGPTVEIHLSAQVHTRLKVVAKRSLPASVANTFHKSAMVQDQTALADLAFYPVDEAWTHELLTFPQAVESIRSLMTLGAGWAILRRVEIRPGEISLVVGRSRRVFGNDLPNTAEVQAWLKALQTVAQRAETIPEAQAEVLPSGSERASRQGMSNFLNYAVAGMLICGPLCMVAVFAVAVAFAMFNR